MFKVPSEGHRASRKLSRSVEGADRAHKQGRIARALHLVNEVSPKDDEFRSGTTGGDDLSISDLIRI